MKKRGTRILWGKAAEFRKKREEVGEEHAREVAHAKLDTQGGLHVEFEKGMEDVVGEHGHEPERHDGGGVMGVDMVGVPFVSSLKP